jgi:hypothetical protein
VRKIVAAVALISLLVVGSKVLPQSPNGSIRGIVLDPEAKAIPDAEIIAVNDATRLQYETKTNGEGIYAVENLPPGPYRLQVSKFGFKAIIKPDIIINVQDALVLNFALEVGASSVVVTVEGGAPMINTTDASVSTVVDRQFAENLPLNGRSFQTLIYLTPGVVATPSNYADSGQFSVNGQRAASNYWMVDGVSANIGIAAGNTPGNGFGGTLGSFSALGGTNSLVSVDALQEFRIQTSTFAPEFGRTPGGQISIVTRSGTNQFHGTAFDYLRNSAFDASNWFNGYTNNPPLPKAEERQNDFGGTFNGPIVKDKTFFFFSYEGLRLRLPQTSLTTVPDIAARQNAIAVMQPYLKMYPLPNGPDNTTEGVAQFNSSYSNPGSLDAYSLRIDQNLTDKWSIFGRYNYSPSQFEVRGGNGFGPLSEVASNRITTQTLTVGTTRNFSSAMGDDLRFNYSRTTGSSDYYLDAFGGAVPLSGLPFPTGYSSANGLFGFFLLDLSAQGIFTEVGKNAQNVQRQINVVDNLSWQIGSHALKMGVDFRRLSPSFAPYAYGQTPRFRTVADVESGTAFLGTIYSNNDVGLIFHNLGAFAQDTWRVFPRLTVTYGVRWDVDFAPSSSNPLNIPAVTGYSLTDFSQLSFLPPGTPPFHTTYGNVAPRLGSAYQLSQQPGWETVFRGGFGVFYDLVSSEAGNVVDSSAPPFGNFINLGSSLFPYAPAQRAPVAIPPTGTLSNVDAINPNLKLPYTLEWNVSVEQALGKDQRLTASYVGAAGRRLLQTANIVDPPSNPNVSYGLFVDNTASSDYNALQLQFQRRLSRGLQGLVSYVFAHSIDDASAGSYGNPSNLNVPGNSNENRGPSDFDIRNSFTAGMTYEIPAPRINALPRALLRDWSIESFVLARSAPPVDLSDENFFEFNGGIETNIRPDIVPGQPLYLYGAQYPGGKAFNPSAFTDPPVDPVTGNPTRQGDLGRNALRGFGATEWDFAVHRDFLFRERFKLQFRTEIFNILNHPNFGPPNNQFGASGFGVANQTLNESLSGGNGESNLGGGALSPLYQFGGPRSVQFALKLIL